jgi:hypothetical protein
MRTMLIAASLCSLACACLAEPPGLHVKQPFFMRSTFATTYEHPQFSLGMVEGNGDELFGEFSFHNISETNKGVRPPVTIRGAQLEDGSFWPFVELQVGGSSDGPWKSVGASHMQGTPVEVTIPSGLAVSGIRVDFTPFKSSISSLPWGRVVLPSGEAAVLDLKELAPEPSATPAPK